GNGCFSNCHDLATVTLNDGLQTIGSSAFDKTALTSVIIPDSVTAVDWYAFDRCAALETVTVLGENTTFSGSSIPNTAVVFCSDTSSAASFCGSGIAHTSHELCARKNSNATVDYDRKLIFLDVRAATDMSDYVTEESTWTRSDTLTGIYCGTGSVVSLSKDAVTNDYTVLCKGDLNGDGICDALDARIVKNRVNHSGTATATEIYAANGCVSDAMDPATYQAIVNMGLAG
ncbi:MAG: leucine-rich repeat protein, partial [Clostridia bacterium]|nr:leucine-rich repeat protein [Clostridia bacterium]